MKTQTSARGYAAENSWAVRAACTHSDPELFFPVAPGGPALRQLDRAKKVCERCPVRIQCLEYAVESGQDFGVWGGASADERRLMRRRLRRRASVLRG